MATLATGAKESDPFFLEAEAFSDLLRDPHEYLAEQCRRRGICLAAAAASDDQIWNVLRSVSEAKTCGDAIRFFKSRHVDKKVWDADLKAAKGAWGAEYIPPDAVLDLVANQLEDNASKWNKHHRYAPLVALIQSSGWGKSRLMCQLWRRGFFVFYVSCMAVKQTGFPRRTENLADILQSPNSTEANFVALVLSIMTVLNKYAARMTCEQWIQAQEKTNQIQGEVHAAYVEKWQTMKRYDMSLERHQAEAEFESFFKQEIDKLEGQKVKLLLCIDEVGELGDNFVGFRRSLRSIPEGKSFFSVVLGTNTKVVGLAAAAAVPVAAEDDASARTRLTSPYSVYHPIYLIGKSDILVKDSGSELEISTAPHDVIRYGRPLWAAYYDSVVTHDKLKETIQLAKMKLLGRNIDTTKAGWVTRDIAVAVFACIVGVEVVAWGSLPQQLAAKHMRTIVHISKGRRRVYTAAAVEPVLAAAAAELLHANDDAFLVDFLDKMIEVFEDGLVLEGVRGEVVARLIIMLAMHECTKSGHYIQRVTLATFLMTMVGKSYVDALDKSRRNLEGYYLFFNSFTPIAVPIFKELAEAAFARCTALAARRNETVLDMALPCHFEASLDSSQSPVQSTERENQSAQAVAVTIQVTNRRKDKPMTKDRKKLQDDHRLSAPAQLFLQIGHRGQSNIQVDHEAVIVYGIDCFEHLNTQKMQRLKVLDKLKVLSRTCEDVFKAAPREELDVLKDMIPLGLVSNYFIEEEMEMSRIPMKWQRTSTRTPRRERQDVQMGEEEDTGTRTPCRQHARMCKRERKRTK